MVVDALHLPYEFRTVIDWVAVEPDLAGRGLAWIDTASSARRRITFMRQMAGVLAVNLRTCSNPAEILRK